MIAIILEWILGCVLLARNLARWGCRLGFPDLACETLDAIEWPPHRRRLEIEWLPEFGHAGSRLLSQIEVPSL